MWCPTGRSSREIPATSAAASSVSPRSRSTWAWKPARYAAAKRKLPQRRRFDEREVFLSEQQLTLLVAHKPSPQLMRRSRETVAAPLRNGDDVREVVLCPLDVVRHRQCGACTDEIEAVLRSDEVACDCPSTEVDGPSSRIAVTGCVDRADHEHQPGRLCASIGVLTNLRRGDRVELRLELTGDHEQRRQALVECGVLRTESFSCSLKKVG